MKAQKLSLLPTSMTNKSLTFRQGLVFILSNFKIGWWAGNSIQSIITHPTNINYLSRLTIYSASDLLDNISTARDYAADLTDNTHSFRFYAAILLVNSIVLGCYPALLTVKPGR